MQDPAPESLAWRTCVAMLLLSAALLSFRLGAVPLLGPDEPRYARVAVEMNRAGEWVTPTLAGRPWMEKPVLYYWLTKPAFALFGESENAVRLPSVLAGVLAVGAVLCVGVRLLGRTAGFAAGLIMATALLPFAYSRAAAMDALLAACVTGAIGLGALRLLANGGHATIVGAYACAALGTLAKGPLGILLPGLVLGTFWLSTRRKDHFRRLVSPWGMAVAILVAGPWYTLILLREGREFVDVFILNHNLQRFTSTIHHHPGPFVYYLPVLLAGLFPWTILIPAGLRGLQLRSLTHRFLAVWLGAPLLFFSLAGSKLPGYILPCVPPLALIAGAAVPSILRSPERPSPHGRWLVVGAVLNLLVSLGIMAAPFALRAQTQEGWMLLLPVGAWAAGMGALGLLWVHRRRLATLLAVGAPGLAVLLAVTTPSLLDSLESGKRLFRRIPEGQDVLVVGANRSAWMAGYFYHECRVREVDDVPGVLRAAAKEPVLVVCGPGACRALESSGYEVRTLEVGPRRNRLVRVSRPKSEPREIPHA